MDFNRYQERALETAKFPEKEWLAYLSLGLVGEAGEIANKVKKIFRDKNGEIDIETISKLVDEMGDVLWYMAILSKHLGVDLNDVAKLNILKLEDRYNRKVIHGDGDNR